MPELPWTKWFPADWLADPKVSRCSEATRGVWMDALAVMMLEQSYFLEGTSMELARLCRTTPQLFDHAFNELLKHDVCEANIKQDGIKRLASRRLKRDCELREKRSSAGSLGGKKKAKPKQTPSPISSSSSSSLLLEKGRDEAWDRIVDNWEVTGIDLECWQSLQTMYPRARFNSVVEERIMAAHNGGITSTFYASLKYHLEKSDRDDPIVGLASGAPSKKDSDDAMAFIIKWVKVAYTSELVEGKAGEIDRFRKLLTKDYELDYPGHVEQAFKYAEEEGWPDGEGLA